MPIVEVNVWKESMDNEKREKLIKKISEDVSEILKAPLDVIEVLINEIPKENWGKGGVQASKWSLKTS